MSVLYPINLPIPLVTGYSHPDSVKVRRNNVVTGPPRFELLSEDGPSFPTVNWRMSQLQFQVFEGWYKYELTFGAKSFVMRLKVGAGLKEHVCFFDKTYKPSLEGKLWRVTAKLVTTEKVYDTEDVYDAAKFALENRIVLCGVSTALSGVSTALSGN